MNKSLRKEEMKRYQKSAPTKPKFSKFLQITKEQTVFIHKLLQQKRRPTAKVIPESELCTC